MPKPTNRWTPGAKPTTPARARDLEGQHMTRAAATNARPLRDVIDHARRAVGYQDHTPAGMDEPTLRRSKPAAVPAGLDLRVAAVSPALRGVAVDVETLDRIDLRALGVSGGAGAAAFGDGSAAGDFAADATHAFDLLQRQAAVARAGATIREFPAERGRVFGVETATFGAVADDADAPDAGVELAEAGAWDMGDDASVQTFACQLTVTRALEKLAGREVIEALVFGALANGAARAIDKHVLDTILAASGTGAGVPDLSALAAAGVTDPEAVVGILGAEALGTGAAMDPATGRAHLDGFGIAAMTDQLTAHHAIVGEWSSVVAMVNPEARIVAERLDASGSLRIVSFVDVWAVPLDPARLFIVDGAV